MSMSRIRLDPSAKWENREHGRENDVGKNGGGSSPGARFLLQEIRGYGQGGTCSIEFFGGGSCPPLSYVGSVPGEENGIIQSYGGTLFS
ncbi:hypothetical protein SLEP1_g57529 [Rubroshorea leprosula]|uniref:Uncharacterized protein n=1 Tax=Rubroshorea leprosula TaxID=152421 RepID=A0AAV5MQ40_9ROSI|nr:hypothetical protein SLEP1_g57529 [Rubroshorea leprosula]